MVALMDKGISLSCKAIAKDNVTSEPNVPNGRFEVIPAPQILRSVMLIGIDFSATVAGKLHLILRDFRIL